MQIKTILNRVQKFKSFVYESVRWVEEAPEPTLEIDLRPRSNGRAECSGCGRRRPGYDRLPKQRFKIDHRLFCHINQNWHGKPVRTFETIVDLIGNTRTNTGLRVKANHDKRKYPLGVSTTKADMDVLSLHRDAFMGNWNHELQACRTW